MTGEACVGTLGLTPELRLHCYASCSSNTMIIFTQSRFNPPRFFVVFFYPCSCTCDRQSGWFVLWCNLSSFPSPAFECATTRREEHGMNTKWTTLSFGAEFFFSPLWIAFVVWFSAWFYFDKIHLFNTFWNINVVCHKIVQKLHSKEKKSASVLMSSYYEGNSSLSVQ